eukprot:CAMPEP_0177169312 /NCGR_PEP_ID=MMETSP0367-20130122/9513_1 /TAXON_ID=447022 ORGANISM="Scrippsiella hangoei-like, Strain SHHI-4" /NCGR_SAMPLE_ID=MMETSP0367 /ASSEMBLY_ACC=CAM_ASM_000362 /LENGTH=31 /DNA_ID= /DNA_START= /DNA_END= /DNA_ORIENTATION=
MAPGKATMQENGTTLPLICNNKRGWNFAPSY